MGRVAIIVFAMTFCGGAAIAHAENPAPVSIRAGLGGSYVEANTWSGIDHRSISPRLDLGFGVDVGRFATFETGAMLMVPPSEPDGCDTGDCAADIDSVIRLSLGVGAHAGRDWRFTALGLIAWQQVDYEALRVASPDPEQPLGEYDVVRESIAAGLSVSVEKPLGRGWSLALSLEGWLTIHEIEEEDRSRGVVAGGAIDPGVTTSPLELDSALRSLDLQLSCVRRF